MLALRALPKSTTGYFRQSPQQLHTSFKILSGKNSSSSSDSSDSDSDKDNKKTKKQINAQPNEDISKTINISDTNERLNALLFKITKASQESLKNQNLKAESQSEDTIKNGNKINVAIKPKQVRLKNLKPKQPVKEKPYEEQLVTAAKDVAKTLKGDQQKTEVELLSKVLNLEKPANAAADKKDASVEGTVSEDSTELSNLLRNMKIQASIPEKSSMIESSQRKGAIHKLKQRFKEPSVAESLLLTKSRRNQRFVKSDIDKTTLKGEHQNLGIMQNLTKEETKDNVQLPIWEEMEKREIKLSLLNAPQNVFQELIQWTEQGKLWQFPINNEQGMQKEEKIHFSEHVFMERHIKDWCPKKGPIRHFMELVCVGLSKNPYMTVEEKVRHITWYKDYFEDKKDLLHELGVLDDKTIPVLQSVDKKQIEA